MQKTNAIRMLESAKISHIIIDYDVSDGDVSAISVANKIGKNPEQVFKTLVTVGKTTGYNVFIVPCEYELNLRKAASCIKEKSIEMIKSRNLESLTGYVHGGCSPIGMKTQFPTYIDEIASLYEIIYVNAGRIGIIVGLNPNDLIGLVDAKYLNFI